MAVSEGDLQIRNATHFDEGACVLQADCRSLISEYDVCSLLYSQQPDRFNSCSLQERKTAFSQPERRKGCCI